MKKTQTTLARLRAALERLIAGKPEKVSRSGKLTLNRINNEAGLGHSYIYKFEDFVEQEAKPAIEAFNTNYDPVKAKLQLNNNELSDIDKLKLKIKKEAALKKQYRQERDNMLTINKELEAQNCSLMFRLYELQEREKLRNVVNFQVATTDKRLK
ncbi:hypothetical protein KIJ96_20315 (plasmid) [Pseudoalteromonas piscicida]|uniref:hypothetical protein n=1 Tax=Pseudoalteromonas piscicida TaxID=43662 RepID=UPI001D09FD5D|nr:hypothetical protein [Pseudoalteromonas piscicida]UDM64320.1 hypothetical protein KIJ96_20315 [Pseudoalteromonas piscicida]